MYLWERYATAPWLAANEWRLEEIAPGAVAIISHPDRARSLVQVACKTEAQASRLMRRFQGSTERLPRRWQESFLQHDVGPPIRIGKRLLIVANARGTLAATKEKQLVIPAAGAFGTGAHATTAMCLRLLERTTPTFRNKWKLLDLGSGTGILALAACLLGATGAVGIDNDPRAVVIAQKNARLNEIEGARFINSDLLKWTPRTRYEVITANLFSELLIAALPIIKRSLKRKGCIILSGILRDQIDRVVCALRATGFSVEKLRRRGRWIALLAIIGPWSARSEWNRKL